MYHKNMCVTINSTFFFFVIFVCQVTMPRKRKLDDDFEEVNPLKKHKPPADRNRASPSALVTTCKDMSDEKMSVRLMIWISLVCRISSVIICSIGFLMACWSIRP